MPLKIWIDGNLVDKEHATVSVYDHGLLYGDGVFEGIRAYNGKVFENAAHARRLFESAKAIRLTIPYTPEQFAGFVDHTVKANCFTDCYIRAVVTRGPGTLGIDPNRCPKPVCFIIADQIQVYPKELYENGIPVVTASVIRNHPGALNPRIKSLNYLNNVLAKIEANDAGVPEAVMLNHLGNVAECTADNIFIVKDGVVTTPPVTEGALDGITRGVVLKLLTKLGLPAREAVIQRHDLYIADEMFLTGTGAEVIPVNKVDGRVIGGGACGPITRRISQAYMQHVRS
jgi:branched-chain amino acid aminotransferase